MASPYRRIDSDTRAVLVTDYKYADVRFEYSAGNMVYKGFHVTHNAGTDDTGWRINKFTWSAVSPDGYLVRIEGPLEGAWDDRAALSWGA